MKSTFVSIVNRLENVESFSFSVADLEWAQSASPLPFR